MFVADRRSFKGSKGIDYEIIGEVYFYFNNTKYTAFIIELSFLIYPEHWK